MLGQNPGQGKNLPFISQQFPYISRQKMEMPGITPSRLKTEADIDNLSERCGGIHPARHQDKLRSTDMDILEAAVFIHFFHPPACSQIIGKGGR